MFQRNTIGLFVISCVLLKFIKCNNYNDRENGNGNGNAAPSLFCSDLNPQHNIDINQVRCIYYL